MLLDEKLMITQSEVPCGLKKQEGNKAKKTELQWARVSARENQRWISKPYTKKKNEGKKMMIKNKLITCSIAERITSSMKISLTET